MLRQQLAVLKRRHPRPSIGPLDKLFWVVVRRFWSGWKQALMVVTPETVVRWHRTGSRMYRRLISRVRTQVGRRPTPKDVRELIFQMVAENPTWGAPRIHGELLMLGFELSERTISRWMKRTPRDLDPAKRWLAFLRNHREAIVAMDFFTVPTISFGVLYCFFVISHDRRRILHFNVTNHPTSLWIVQQLREAFPFESAPRFLIFDRDAKYALEVPAAVRSLKISPVRTSFESPWQNGVAERWVESCRRDLLDHIIAVNERHLKRLLRTREGNAERQNSFGSLRLGPFSGAIGRPPASLRSSCLIRINFPPVLNIYVCARHARTGPCPYVRGTRARVPVPQNLCALSKQC